MCVILVAPHVEDILELGLDDAWGTNPDGAGYAYRELDGSLGCVKGIMKLKALEESLLTVPDHSSFVLHLRIATHGGIKPEFTHPFSAGKDALLFHNGIITELGKSGRDGYSDSAHLATILSRLDTADRFNVLKIICGTSKFVYMDRRQTWMFGHFSETKVKGVMASNLYFETRYVRSRGTYGHVNRSETVPKDAEIEDAALEIDGAIVQPNGYMSNNYWCDIERRWKPLPKLSPEEDKPSGLIKTTPLPRGGGTVHVPFRGDTGHKKTQEVKKGDKDPQEVETKDATSSSGEQKSLIAHPEDRDALNGFCNNRRVTPTREELN